MPKLSVIIPVYNTAQYLRLCIDSVLSQSFEDVEVICVDNCSTDGSADILREYAAKDSRIKYLVTDKHGRATEARQFGLQAAQGEFITFVDSDDSIKPGMYAHMLNEHEKHNADIVVCNYDMVYPDKILPSYSDMRNETIEIAEMGYPKYFEKYFCMQRPNNYLWSRIIRRSLAVEHSIEFQPVDISEDTIFIMFCTVFAKRVVHINDSYYNYFQREDSTVRQTIRNRNVAHSYVYAFDCVEKYVHSQNLMEVFRDILPMYAVTRVRSVIFYNKLIGKDESTIFDSLISALREGCIAKHLRIAVNKGLISDISLAQMVCRLLHVLDGEQFI